MRKKRGEPGGYVEPLMAADHMADLVQDEMLVVQAAGTLSGKDVVSGLGRDPQPARHRASLAVG